MTTCRLIQLNLQELATVFDEIERMEKDRDFIKVNLPN